MKLDLHMPHMVLASTASWPLVSSVTTGKLTANLVYNTNPHFERGNYGQNCVHYTQDFIIFVERCRLLCTHLHLAPMLAVTLFRFRRVLWHQNLTLWTLCGIVGVIQFLAISVEHWLVLDIEMDRWMDKHMMKAYAALAWQVWWNGSHESDDSLFKTFVNP